MRFIRSLALGAFFVLVPALASAQAISSPYEYIETRHAVGVFGGYLYTDPGSLDVGPEPAPLFGVRYSINLTGPLYGDVELGAAPATRTIYARTANTPNPPLVALGETDALLFLAQGALRFQLTGARTWHGFAPYLVLSGGIASNATQSSNLEEVLTEDQLFRFGPAFAAGGGLGTQFFLTEHLSLRVDFRDYLWRLDRPVGLTGSTEKESEWRHNFGLTLGSALHF